MKRRAGVRGAQRISRGAKVSRIAKIFARGEGYHAGNIE